jgi:hypothetical protein
MSIAYLSRRAELLSIMLVIAGLGDLAELAAAFAAFVRGCGLMDGVGAQTKIAGPATNAGVVVAAGTCGHAQVVEHKPIVAAAVG